MDIAADKDQITDTSILNDAFARKKPIKVSTKVNIADLDELKDYQLRKRTEYESYLKRNRLDMGQWIRYALFEIEQHDIRRARSIFERALLVDTSYIPLWIRYIDSELKLKYINHARNLLDRAVSTLPRVDKLWYKYLFVEESLENWDVVRSLYNKWTSLEPGTNAWNSYVEFEIRQNQWDNVRRIYSRYVNIFPETTDIWFKWIKFETVYGSTTTTRQVYSLAVDSLISHENSLAKATNFQENLLDLIISFANWEASKQELERAKAIFNVAIEKWPNNTILKNALLNFDKRYGDNLTINGNILLKRKSNYEKILLGMPRDYDTWWIYLDLMEENFPSEFLVSVEKATDIANKPLIIPKSKIDIAWQRYLFLWIRHLTYIELQLNDIDHCRQLYNKLIDDIIPHSNFTYNKIWIMFAHFEIRQENIPRARQILGKCIGLCPSDEIFQEYINIEIKLKEFDRVRTLYEKFIEFKSNDISTWFTYAQLEENLGDEDRARGIFKIMLNPDVMNFSLDVRKEVMEKFITFETDAEEYNNGRALYRDYLKLTNYSVEVWISYAMYECSVPTEEQLSALSEANENLADDEEIQFEPAEVNFDKGREVYEEALTYFKTHNDPFGRIKMLEALQEFENKFGNETTQDTVTKRMPIKKISHVLINGVETERVDYVFPDDSETSEPIAEPQSKVPKFLAMANKWKQQQNK
ncbi:pre-mRNA-splicing factor Clf1p [Monosporozyma servazzii]